MPDEILKTLLEKIITKNEALELAEKFDLLKKKIFSSRADWKESLKSQLGEDLYAVLSAVPGQKELSDIFEKFTKEAASLDTARLDIAFDPTYEFLSKISEWISREAGHKVILDINVSKKLIGGLQVSFGGHFTDASLEKKIKDSLR